MYEFEVSIIKHTDFAVLRANGYINNLGGERLAQTCYTLIDDGFIKFILNLGGSKVVNSIGISILIEVIEKILEKKGRLAFCNLTPTVAKTFKIMGLLHYTELFTDEDEAKTQFLNKDDAGGPQS